MVIVGSASLYEKIEQWKSYWENQDFQVVNFPAPIPEETFLTDYPMVHTRFFGDLECTDTVFIMNEDKKGKIGYIGAESFAELCFAVAQNLLHERGIDILLLQMPEESVQSYEEIQLWLKLGWIKLFEGNLDLK